MPHLLLLLHSSPAWTRPACQLFDMRQLCIEGILLSLPVRWDKAVKRQLLSCPSAVIGVSWPGNDDSCIMEIRPIAFIHTEFSEKFGIPRQSGLAGSLRGKIVFGKEFRSPDAVRGLEDFSHIWLIWEFSSRKGTVGKWQPVVRPPRLGGNAQMGLWATRSPFRPNPIGLSCVELESIVYDAAEGPVIYVKGADLMDGTPIYDIKPYIRYADSRPEAVCGYVDSLGERRLDVVIPETLRKAAGENAAVLSEVLGLDPRPSYQNDPERVYGMSFCGLNVKFTVSGDVLVVCAIEKQG